MAKTVKKSIIATILIVLTLSHTPVFAEELITAQSSFPGSLMPTAQRKRLAHSVLRNKWQRDAEVNQYLLHVNKLLIEEEDYFFTLAAIDQVNAFAYIGGLIVVYSGLWVSSESEDEFLSVMAHEMGHIKLDHFNKAKNNNKEAAIIALPVLIAGALLSNDKEVTKAVIASSTGFLASDFVAYSRELEHEADIFALDLMIKRMRNAGALINVYRRFTAHNNEYLSTHPAPKRRSAYIHDRIQNIPFSQPPYRADFYLLREKLEFMQGRNSNYRKDKIKKLNDPKLTSNEKNVLRYGLLLHATKHYDTVLGDAMVKMLENHPHPFIQRAIGHYYNIQKRYKKAIAVLKPVNKSHPDNIAIIAELLKAYHLTQQYEKNIAFYHTLPATIQQHVGIATLVSKSAEKMNNASLGNYILANAYAWDGQFEQAMRQISVAEIQQNAPIDILLKITTLKELLQKEMEWASNQK